MLGLGLRGEHHVAISAGSPDGGGERGLAARSVFEGPVPQLPWEVSSGARGLPACPLPSGFWGFKTR